MYTSLLLKNLILAASKKHYTPRINHYIKIERPSVISTSRET
jgi:hypothetical protein